MAYTFSRAATRYLSTTAPVTTTPLTISAWSYPTAAAAYPNPVCTLVSLQDRSGNNYRFQLGWSGYASYPYRALIEVSGPIPGGGSTTGIQIPGVVTLNTWQHLAGVFVGQFERYVYFNGTASAKSTAGLVPANISRLLIGTCLIGTVESQYIGRIAEVGVWNAALTADEIKSLAAGMSPELVRPQSLVFYAPLIRDLTDKVGGRILTNVNSVPVGDHTRIFT
jgi:hypothetical protein